MRPDGSTRTKIGLLGGLCLGLGACNSVGAPSSMSLEDSVAPPPSARMQALAPSTSLQPQAPSQAVATLPEDAGTVASVRSHAYVNGFRQDILLKGSAVRGIENSITVLARTSSQTTLDEATPLYKPTEAAIRSEMGRQFPKIPMQVVERSSSNSYGPYGLALGRAGASTHCIYMWQWIDQSRLIAAAGVPGPVSLRIRLCKADTTFDALAALVDHLSISRNAAAESTADATVAPPDDPQTEAKSSRKHVAAHHPHRTRQVTAHRDDNEPGYETAMPAAAPASQPLATDLPPQAFMGPKSGSSAIKPN